MRHLLILIFLISYLEIDAQQNGIWNQSLFNYYSINSAYAGSKNTSSFGLSYRSQWTGFEGAPSTQYLTYHAPIKKARMGFGLKLENESIGIKKSLKVEGSFAYHIKTHKGIFSMGADAGLDQNSYSFNELDLFETDLIFNSSGKVKNTSPTFGFSMLYQSNSFIGGIKASELFSNQLNIIEGAKEADPIRYDVFLGAAKRLSKTVVWKPYGIVNTLNFNQLSYYFNSTFSLRNKFTLGAGYRNDQNVNLLLHYFVRKNLRIGYSYEMGITNINAKNLNTHEIFMGLNTGKESGELVSPRFYDL